MIDFAFKTQKSGAKVHFFLDMCKFFCTFAV